MQAGDSLFAAGDLPQPDWGSIALPANGTGLVTLEVRAWPSDGKLALPTPFPNLTAAHLFNGRERAPLKWVFNADATSLHLELSARPPTNLPATIILEAAETTAQVADGHITFSALDARVQGNRAKL
jgi:hypothetical protein